MEAVTGEEVRDYGRGGARSVRNSQVLDNMLKEATGLSKLSLYQGDCAEGKNSLSMEARGLQRLEVGGEGASAQWSSWLVLVPRKWQ